MTERDWCLYRALRQIGDAAFDRSERPGITIAEANAAANTGITAWNGAYEVWSRAEGASE